MKKISATTLYSLAVVIIFGLGLHWLQAAEIPLNQAPFVKDSNTRGQYKVGPLTIGSSSTGTSALTVVGAAGLQVEGVDCSAGVFAGSDPRPCPYPNFSTGSTGTEFRVLGSGSGVGGYMQSLVTGAQPGTVLTPQTSLDVRGTITADPAPSHLGYPQGALYPNSTTDKPLCALPNGDIIVCGSTTSGSSTGGGINSGNGPIINPGTAPISGGGITPSGSSSGN